MLHYLLYTWQVSEDRSGVKKVNCNQIKHFPLYGTYFSINTNVQIPCFIHRICHSFCYSSCFSGDVFIAYYYEQERKFFCFYTIFGF